MEGNDQGNKGPVDQVATLFTDWQQARYIWLLLCRVQQRLESRILARARNSKVSHQPQRRAAWSSEAEETLHLVAQEAEALAIAEALQLQDAIADVEASSMVGVIAKLELIVASEPHVGEQPDFPWPHIASVLHDLKRLVGRQHMTPRHDRMTTRAIIARHWNGATELVAHNDD